MQTFYIFLGSKPVTIIMIGSVVSLTYIERSFAGSQVFQVP